MKRRMDDQSPSKKETTSRVKRLAAGIVSLVVLLAVPHMAYAQEASFTPPATELVQEAERAVPSATIYLDAQNGEDTNSGAKDTEAVKTFAKAMQLVQEGGTLVVKSFDTQSGILVNKAIHLVIDNDLSLTGTPSVDGISLKKGATLTVSAGKTLSMKNYKTAIVVEKDAVLSDGNYSFQGNGKSVDAAGRIAGSTDKNSLHIVALDNDHDNFPKHNAVIKNATIALTSNKRTWRDGTNLTLENVELTLSGYGMGFYVNQLNMLNSTLVMKNGGGGWFGGFRNATGMTFQGGKNRPSTIQNSTLEFDYGSNAGLSIGSDSIVNVENSTLRFKNMGAAGLNVNQGQVILKNSTITGDGTQSKLLFGAQGNAPTDRIQFLDNANVETPATKDSHNGGAKTKGAYVVLGGSHRIKYAPDYHSSLGSTLPTNGKENGDEILSYFKLADPATRELKPINQKGQAYTYKVETTSGDGNKYVWVPKATVTFVLGDNDAVFADQSKEAKTQATIRGYALHTVAGNPPIDAPILQNPATNKAFQGWYYTDAQGVEQKFDAATTPVTADMTVTAKWENTAKYTVTFNTNGGNNLPAVTVKAGDSIDLSKIVPTKTNAQGKENIFLGWYTEPHFAETSQVSGKYTPERDVTLYAKWDIHPDPIENQLTIWGDILVQKAGEPAFTTQHKEEFKVHRNDRLNFKATIEALETQQYLDLLKRQLLQDRRWFSEEREGVGIPLHAMSSRFVAKITVPEGLDFPTEKSRYQLDGGPFRITDVRKNNRVIHVIMDLDTTKLPTFADLYEAIYKPLELLTLDVSDIQVKADAALHTPLTVIGTVDGNFAATAVSPIKEGNPHQEQKFSFQWKALQDRDIPGTQEDGQDSTLNNDNNNPQISLTVRVEPSYEVLHQFASATAGKPLPEEVTKLLPAKQSGKGTGEIVTPTQPLQSEVADRANQGRWLFKGYQDLHPQTPEVDAVVKDADVVFVGTWEFIPGQRKINEAPRLEVEGRTIEKGSPLNLKDLVKSATDQEDGDLKDKVEIIDDGGFHPNQPGEYKITFKVADSQGASVTKTAIVKVVEKKIVPQDPTEGGNGNTPYPPNEGGKKPTPPAAPLPASQATALPKTGESRDFYRYAALMMLLAASAGCLLVFKRREDN